MKLIIQIPCFNEAETLPEVFADLPRQIEGIDVIETLIIDDGSSDGTSAIAAELGVDHIVRHKTNRGLARSFMSGIDECLRQGADIIVNTDGDNQYNGHDIHLLVKPVLAGSADIVVGDRGGLNNPHFSAFKKRLQVVGSATISRLTNLKISDAVSGFRAFSRSAAERLNIVSEFSYTIETLVQAGANRLSVVSVPIRTNPKTRESRLFRSIPQFLRMSGLTLARIYTMYKPLRVFVAIGAVAIIAGLVPIGRFLFYYFTGSGAGHIQSLLLGSTLLILGFITILIGIVADLISFNRKLLETALVRINQIERVSGGGTSENQEPD